MSGTALVLLAANALFVAEALPMFDSSVQSVADAPTAEANQTEILQGQTDLYNRMTVNVALEGTGPYRFLIDTGSQRTIVSTALANRLGLTLGPTVRVIGMAGTLQASTARIDTLAVGTREHFDLVVPLLEDRHIGADGIIGTDNLQDQRVLLDFTQNTMEIGDARELGGTKGYEIVVHTRKRSGRLIMTNAEIDGVRVDVVIDTGASGSVGNLALQKALREQPHGAAILTSVTGDEVSANIGYARKLNIGRIAVSNVVIAFADAQVFAELGLRERPAIFLGMRELRVFKRVAIDFGSRRVLFDLPSEG